MLVREAFFNFLFHVVSDYSKSTCGRAANSKVKTQKSFFQQSHKKKRKRKKRASDEIWTRKYRAQVRRRCHSAKDAYALQGRPNCCVSESRFECFSMKKKKKRRPWLGSNPWPLGWQSAALTTALWYQHGWELKLTEPGTYNIEGESPVQFSKTRFLDPLKSYGRADVKLDIFKSFPNSAHKNPDRPGPTLYDSTFCVDSEY